MATIKTLKHGFTRITNDRLAGFAEITATEDGRVLIPVLIGGPYPSDPVTEHSATFSPWFALEVARTLTEQAHAAMQQTERRTGEALVAAGLAAQEAGVERDRAVAEIARLLANQVEARIADALPDAEDEG